MGPRSVGGRKRRFAFDRVAKGLQCPSSRASRLGALGKLDARSAVPALSKALSDDEARVREQVSWALGKIEDKAALPALIGAMEDSSDDVREQTAWALGRIEDDSAVDVLVKALGDAGANSVGTRPIEDDSAVDVLVKAPMCASNRRGRSE